MAVSQGSTLLSSDMRSWYTRLNTVISKYGGGITQLTVPAANKSITVSDMNAVVNKFNSIKTDAYLGNDSSIYTAGYSTVSQGEIITAAKGTAILTTLTRLEAIRCRNDARYSQGNSNTLKSNTDSKSANQNTNSNRADTNGNRNTADTNGNSNTADRNGNNNTADRNGNSRSANQHGDAYSRNSDGYSQTARTYDRCYVSSRYNTNQCYFWGQSRCDNGNSNSRNGNGDSNTKDTNGNSNTKKTNGDTKSANTHDNSKSAQTNGDSKSVNGHGDSNTRHQHDNNKSANSNGTRIDIYNSRTVV